MVLECSIKTGTVREETSQNQKVKVDYKQIHGINFWVDISTYECSSRRRSHSNLFYFNWNHVEPHTVCGCFPCSQICHCLFLWKMGKRVKELSSSSTSCTVDRLNGNYDGRTTFHALRSATNNLCLTSGNLYVIIQECISISLIRMVTNLGPVPNVWRLTASLSVLG